MTNTPTENTLTVNATHHMLGDLEERFTGPAALSPNRRMENILGYDTNLPLLKSVVFQYKRPYTVESDSDHRFSVNRDQWRTLTSLYEYNQAFFVFPEVVNATNLEHTLSRSVFIDVFGIRKNTSLVYVPEMRVLEGDQSVSGRKSTTVGTIASRMRWCMTGRRSKSRSTPVSMGCASHRKGSRRTRTVRSSNE